MFADLSQKSNFDDIFVQNMAIFQIWSNLAMTVVMLQNPRLIDHFHILSDFGHERALVAKINFDDFCQGPGNKNVQNMAYFQIW